LNCKKVLSIKKPKRFVKDQLGPASFSIILNIAEGSGKSSTKDRKNYFIIARASVFECVAVIDVMQNDEKIDKETYQRNLQLASEISRMLYTMIKNLTE